MPKNSSHCLPKSYQKEMLSENSPLSDYYPSDFKSDLYLGDVEWKSIVLLPFIDSTRLRNVTSKLPLDEAEQVRNQFKFSKIYFNLNPNTEKTFNEINNYDDFALYSFDNVQGWLKTVGKNSPFGKIIESPVTNEKYPDIKCESHSAFFVNPCSENEYKANLYPLLNKSIQKDVGETNDSVEESQPKKKVAKKKSAPIQEEETIEPVPKKIVKKKVQEMEEPVEESQPVPKKKVVKKKAAQEMEEESIEPVQEAETIESVPKKKVVKKKAVQEEEIVEPVPKKKVVKKKSAPIQEEETIEPVPKKKVVKKKAVQDMEEEPVEESQPVPKKKVVKKKEAQEMEEESIEPVPKKKVVKRKSAPIQEEIEEVTKKRKLSNGSEGNKKKIKI
jgi:hypothetical protein